MSKPFQYKIAVIIVNYNVEFFLEQCLNSVQKALENVSGQVFVVDNNSIDGSVEMVERKFPQFNLIANKDNKGFSKANNQGILLTDAEYILLLNPDTVVEEDTFSKVIEYMDTNPKTGGLGVRMLDGKGHFLPESKRGLPTPTVAFYKIFGLSKLFPKSKKFGQYHAGHLSEFETNKIDILSGAFMLMRREALDKVGLLDEAFFMYGEDIDLSYRIQQGGYENVYFPETRIIHYKGESTKKSSVNYVFVFYKAMIIFANKHFSQKNAKLFSFFIHLAIYFRAFLAITARFIKRSFLPIFDFTIILFGFNLLSNQWKVEQISFPENITHIAFPAYALIWVLSILFHGGYDVPLKLKKFNRGIISGTLIILVAYALFPKSWQFSRLFILIAALGLSFYFSLSRIILHLLIGKNFNLARRKNKKFAIIGSFQEFKRVSEILKQTNEEIGEIVFVAINSKENEAVGTLNQLDQITFIHQINELVFCAKDTTAQAIIYWMTKINAKEIDFKIAQPDSLSLIGSNSIETAGDLYVLNINAITKEENIRTKRTFDLIVSVSLILTLPIVLLFVKNKKKFSKNMIYVFVGKKSIVGYADQKTNSLDLPRIKPGILHPADELTFKDDSLTDKLNLIYARDYKVLKDLTILSKSFDKLDR